MSVNNNPITYSFIIPVKNINDYINETVTYIQDIQRNDWELLIIPDQPSTITSKNERIRIFPSGKKTGPAYKRDYGSKKATGQILVFLDDDSYPNNDILDIADQYFKNPNIIALGGPGITPLSDSFWQKVSGAVFLSKFSGGSPERYQSVGSCKKVYDWPSVNLMVRKEVFEKVGGFNSEYWPGEDTLLCQKLNDLNHGDIYYIPEMVVWHHRRPGLLRHLNQISAYALHRGFFAKNFGGNSSKLIYFIPSGFALFCIISLILFSFNYALEYVYFLWVIYFLSLLISIIDICKYHNLAVAAATVPYIILTHFFYGINFVRGYFKKNIKSRLR